MAAPARPTTDIMVAAVEHAPEACPSKTGALPWFKSMFKSNSAVAASSFCKYRLARRARRNNPASPSHDPAWMSHGASLSSQLKHGALQILYLTAMSERR
eukprot:CAMPEP_0113504110 /NCGR_PEP_ID=MMETSP0014_2-20120614/34541_1 /TAXON_ID=2857 /ORGANISM="Nitzschia sp." /LENGTH=99 /DNA_ID=CAMNT_0000399199 /DNA_START=761 /DNA_END=1060 /DNA_ORIENTATION=+ /assembly_acc=CAM_ASM_000159